MKLTKRERNRHWLKCNMVRQPEVKENCAKAIFTQEKNLHKLNEHEIGNIVFGNLYQI